MSAQVRSISAPEIDSDLFIDDDVAGLTSEDLLTIKVDEVNDCDRWDLVF